MIRRVVFDSKRLRPRRAGASLIPVDSRLHLMIVVEPDGIDSNRYLLSYWRQGDPAEWSPARAATLMVTFNELDSASTTWW
jgi:hypothetical protein